MAENIRKVYPFDAKSGAGSWYDDTDFERYNRVINVLDEYKNGRLDKQDVRWFLKCTIINNIYISDGVKQLGDKAWKNPKNPRLIVVLAKLSQQKFVTHKEIDIAKYRKNICFEHIVPYNLVHDVLVEKHNNGTLSYIEFQRIRSKLNICLVTNKENKDLGKYYRQKMPKNTDWLNTSGDEFARYKKTGVVIYGMP